MLICISKRMIRVAFLSVAVVGTMLIGAATVSAQQSNRSAKSAEAKAVPVTKVTIEGMHCAGCAKKVEKKLATVKNVAKVKIDFETSIATITPKDNLEFSCKAIWEAVETSGFKPTKLVNAKGTITEKPKA